MVNHTSGGFEVKDNDVTVAMFIPYSRVKGVMFTEKENSYILEVAYNQTTSWIYTTTTKDEAVQEYNKFVQAYNYWVTHFN